MATEDVNFRLGFDGTPAQRALKQFQHETERENKKFLKRFAGAFSAFGIATAIGAAVTRAWSEAVRESTKLLEGQAKAAERGSRALEDYNRSMGAALYKAQAVKQGSRALGLLNPMPLLRSITGGAGGLFGRFVEGVTGVGEFRKERGTERDLLQQQADLADARANALKEAKNQVERDRIDQQSREEQQAIDALITESQREAEARPGYGGYDYKVELTRQRSTPRSRMQAQLRANRARFQANRDAFLANRLRTAEQIGLGAEKDGYLDKIAGGLMMAGKSMEEINKLMGEAGVKVVIVNTDDGDK